MLNNTRLKALRPRDKIYRVADAHGLAIEIRPNGACYWRLRYRFNGKARMLSLGRYPDVSLAGARKSRDAAQKQLSEGIDPSQKRQIDKTTTQSQAANTFEGVGRQWLAQYDVAPVTAQKSRWLLESFAFPYIGKYPTCDITSRQLLNVLRKVERTGKHETANRLKIKCGQVFRYAIIEGLADTDPTISLRGALKAPKVKHHSAMTRPDEIGGLLRAIDGYTGSPVTLAALRLAPLVFLRPGELRQGVWSEIDFERAEWRIPGRRMKMGDDHLVPLARQAMDILEALKLVTGPDGYIFPSSRTWSRPMSENTVNAALRRMGFTKEEMTAHGFRSMAATRLNEMGIWTPDAIERQLAHAERNKVRGAYISQAEYLPERQRMMQAWADYLDQLRASTPRKNHS